MSLNYAWEKFHNAVRALAAIDDDIKSRLEIASINSIMHVDPERDLPDNLRDEYKLIIDELTAEVSIPETISSMSKEEASNLAKKIVSLFVKIVREDAKE